MKSYLLRCILIFFLAFSGMTCLVIVDTISGTMVGYEPELGLTINEIEDNNIEATVFGQEMDFNVGTLFDKF